MSKIVYYLIPSSFCFGVERAIKKLNSIILSHSQDKIFCIHALVHNPKVTKDFEKKGVCFVESIDDILENDVVVVFSAHGINRVILDQAKKRFKAVYNLECPFVTKIYDEIDTFFEQGISTFFYIGKYYHQEAQNVISYIKSKGCEVFVFLPQDPIPQIDPQKKIALLSQTTLNFYYVNQTFSLIKKSYPHVFLPFSSDVCKATYERQKIILDNLDIFDALVVIGGKQSNNTKELVYLGTKNNKKTFYGESFDEILFLFGKNELLVYDKIAITGGASTPVEDIRAVFDFYKNHGYEPKVLQLTTNN